MWPSSLTVTLTLTLSGDDSSAVAAGGAPRRVPWLDVELDPRLLRGVGRVHDVQDEGPVDETRVRDLEDQQLALRPAGEGVAVDRRQPAARGDRGGPIGKGKRLTPSP